MNCDGKCGNMSGYISDIGKAMKKYRTEIISGATSVTLTCFSLGCNGPSYNGNRGLTLRDVQDDLCHKTIVIGDNGSYRKYVTCDGSKIVIIGEGGAYGIYSSSTGEDLTLPRPPIPSSSSQGMVVIRDHSGPFSDSIHELERHNRRLALENSARIRRMQLELKRREAERELQGLNKQ